MLDNAGWVTAHHAVRCVACSQPVPAGSAAYAANRVDSYNLYCSRCGVDAEKAVNALHNGEREPYQLGYKATPPERSAAPQNRSIKPPAL